MRRAGGDKGKEHSGRKGIETEMEMDGRREREAVRESSFACGNISRHGQRGITGTGENGNYVRGPAKNRLRGNVTSHGKYQNGSERTLYMCISDVSLAFDFSLSRATSQVLKLCIDNLAWHDA